MPDDIEAEVSGTFVHAGDGEVYSDGETCEVSEATIERHPTVLKRADGNESDESADEPEDGAGNPGDDSSTDGNLTDLDGVGEALAEKLRETGVESTDDVRGADPEALARIDGISEDHAAALTESED